MHLVGNQARTINLLIFANVEITLSNEGGIWNKTMSQARKDSVGCVVNSKENGGLCVCVVGWCVSVCVCVTMKGCEWGGVVVW